MSSESGSGDGVGICENILLGRVEHGRDSAIDILEGYDRKQLVEGGKDISDDF
jgi:hypothetical protein